MQLASILGGFSASWGCLGRSWRPLGPSWRPLGALLETSWPILAPSWFILEASWGVLEPSWASKIHRRRWFRAGSAAPGPQWRVCRTPSLGFLRIFFGFPYVYPLYILRKRRLGRIREGKEDEKEVRHRTLYAMRRHKAWRGGSNAQQSCVPATALDLKSTSI